MADKALSTGQQIELKDVPPEEEELFREFQSYVRTIYMAATDGAVQSLQQATEGLRNQVAELQATVKESRQDFITLFDPAVQSFNASTETTLQAMTQRQELISKQQEERFEQALRKLTDEHRALAKTQSDSYSVLVESSSKMLKSLLIAALCLLVVSLGLTGYAVNMLIVLLRR